MSKKKKKIKSIEELTKNFEKFIEEKTIQEKEFNKNLEKIIKKHKKA